MCGVCAKGRHRLVEARSTAICCAAPYASPPYASPPDASPPYASPPYASPPYAPALDAWDNRKCLCAAQLHLRPWIEGGPWMERGAVPRGLNTPSRQYLAAGTPSADSTSRPEHL
eukprot:356396-Chlamydomonas_euryale.AAC.6